VIDVDGERIAWCRSGKGPPVVCLHAIAHGGGDFQAFADLARSHEVIRIDWPGHGRSGPASEQPSAGTYAALLAKILDRLQIAAPVVIGCSIGGAAALAYARSHPVRALVLCDTGGLVPVDAITRAVTRTGAAFFHAGERGAWWFPAAYAFYYRRLVLPAAAAAAQRQRIIAAGRELAPLSRSAWESFGRPDSDLRAAALALDVPVWVAWARSDRVIPLRLVQPCIKQMKRATLTLFEGGHAAFLEQPEAFVREFEAFVAGLAATPASAAGHTNGVERMQMELGARHASMSGGL
jgi:4,5:9,10-diseco-3-hydroxy-5,9,17-trioxoandrosta-1(10),2-diene-4-oate hydrolase